MMSSELADLPSASIAIIGMAGRFPGATNVGEFWQNQLNGVEAIRQFSRDELDSSLAQRASEPGFVAARSVLDDADLFDAEFFGIYPKEAELTDPQHRLFLETCWQSFEDAGYDPTSLSVPVGVFAGCSMPTYFLSQLCSDPRFVQRFTGGYHVENYAEMIGNSRDFLTTRVSYKLGLHGPSFTLQAGCSTSLVAVCQACQSLLTRQCDMALAGGSSITFPQNRGARYQEGGMISPDGHCRTFDENANGTVFGSGVAAVLLKRLQDAIQDGDQIYALIRGFGLNNDGSAKAGFTAPSIEGQARVIELAHQVAGIDPKTVGYIEAHGTATPLGDPIELTALARVFQKHTRKKHFCVIGTAKTNVGHLDIASGVTGLIHATQIVRHGIFPPTLHFQRPNPKFDLDGSPFLVQKAQALWPKQDLPRRAGVSAFGVGGTNAHVIIEEGPPVAASLDPEKPQLLVLSARSESALQKASENLAQHLEAHPELRTADVAYTLQVGRKEFTYRRAVVAKDSAEAITALRKASPNIEKTFSDPPAIVFLFPGQGSQTPGMAADLYDTEPLFRSTIDHCANTLQPILREDLRAYLCVRSENSHSRQISEQHLRQTRIAQPALFTFEFALARLLQSWGLVPGAMLGHSIGEYTAAALAGVLEIDDALRLVARRGELMQSLPPGAMVAVRLAQHELQKYLDPSLSIAAVNAPSQCVVSGPEQDIAQLEQRLTAAKVLSRRLRTSHAFHSAMMDPILDSFSAEVRAIEVGAPQIRYVSNLTGSWADESVIRDPAYWSQHLRNTVQFSAGIAQLQQSGNFVLLEVGPGDALTAMALQHSSASAKVRAFATTDRKPGGGVTSSSLLEAIGSLWTAAVRPNWRAVHGSERRFRVSLPTYPFERKRFWFESTKPAVTPTAQPATAQLNRATSEPKEASEVTTTTAAPIPQKVPHDRVESIASALEDSVAELSGMTFAPEQRSATFLELGFDSLFLTQVVLALKNKFAVALTFRDLMSDYSSIATLAQHLDRVLPAHQFAPEPMFAPRPAAPATQAAQPSASTEPQPIVPSVTPVNGAPSQGGSLFERVVQQQLQAMNQLFAQQLQTIQAQPAATGTTNEGRPAVSAQTSAVTSMPAAADAALARPTAKSEPVAIESKPFGPYKPPQLARAAKLETPQKKFIADLIARYTERTARSKAFTQQHRAALADPRVVSGFRPEWKEMVYPIITSSSKGSHLWDIDGNEYIDILNGFGPIFVGHRPDFIERAVEEQLHHGFEIGPQSPLAGEVAQLFCELTGNERMTFCNTGSEAVLAALRVARTATGRSKVVLFAGAYHGMFDEVLVKGVNAAGRPHTLPIAPGIPKESVSNVIVLEYGAPSSLDWIREHAKELAAVLVEPVQSRHPDLQPRDFLRELRRITAESGAALIFDEVVTGFRVHPGGCQALFDIRADLATYGKVLAGGMPIGVLAGRDTFMNALDGGMWSFGDESCPTAGVTFFAGTFVRHPLALAAAKAMLQHLKDAGPSLQSDLNTRAKDFAAKLNAAFDANSVPAHLENFSSIFYFHFPPDFWLGSLLFYQLRLRGIYILEGFPFFLTTAHTEQDLETILKAFSASFAELRDAGILGAPAASPEEPARLRDDTATPPSVLEPGEPAVTLVPMTEEQLEIALAAQLSPQASCAYNESFTMRLRGPLRKSALLTSLQTLVARHESLRIAIQQDTQSCAIQPTATLPITEHDLSQLPPSEARSRVSEILRAEATTAFDFAAAPLARAHLIRNSDDDHSLVFTAHHIVCDGWSTNVVLNELSSLYAAAPAGNSASLPPAPRFADYARAQNDLSTSQPASTQTVLRSAGEFWREQFKTLPPPLELPTDRPRPAMRSFAGATARVTISADALREIRAAGARQGCTLFSTLLAGFAALLHRLTSQDDIVIGIPAAGQSALPDSDLVGHCVNFLPLRFTIAQGTLVSQFLGNVRRAVLDAYEHQNYTYGTLVRELQIPREPGRLPLLEVQFNLEKIGADLHFPGLQVEVDPNPKAAVNFDLFLNVVETPSGLLLDCDYNSDLFDDSTIRRWLGHFETLLKSLAAEPTAEINRIAVLTDSERKQILVDWNQTEQDYPRDLRVHVLIQQQANKIPDSTAIICGETHITYSTLDRRSNQLARHLHKIGVRPGDLVGVCVERSPEMVIALLAAWKAGAAYVPLDYSHPTERLDFLLEDAQVSVLVTESTLLDQLPACNARLVCLDRDEILFAREPEHSFDMQTSAEALAYVIYTSGSTGKPKGVAVTHRNVVNLLCSTLREPGLLPSDRLLAVTTLSFDIAALELFLPLIAGACVVLAGRQDAIDGARLRNLMHQHDITVMQATPATWKMLIEADWSEKLKILCGGEALSRDLADQLLTRGEVWNMYGPTETTIWSSASKVAPGPEPVPIGPPLGNTQFYVLDSLLQPVPIGARGELFIGGEGVAKGYHHRPDLTETVFLSDPFRPGTSNRIYRTGDLVRYRPNGLIDFLGRTDHQVKIRGFRIELQEVEAALARQYGIREAVVFDCDDDHGLKRLVAYIVLTPDATVTQRTLRRNLAGLLPSYMVPSSFVFLDQLPRTPNGKIDRRSLPSWREQPTIEPSTERRNSNLETQLVEICSEVLGLASVDPDASLFDLGADSLHVFQIVARAASRGIPLQIEYILRLRTISDVAEELESRISANDSATTTAPELRALPRDAFKVAALAQ